MWILTVWDPAVLHDGIVRCISHAVLRVSLRAHPHLKDGGNVQLVLSPVGLNLSRQVGGKNQEVLGTAGPLFIFTILQLPVGAEHLESGAFIDVVFGVSVRALTIFTIRGRGETHGMTPVRSHMSSHKNPLESHS